MDTPNLKDTEWRISYRTSGIGPDGRPVDILHDFYNPALRRSVRYDRVAGYFRSTSLAAASQGFSALVNRGGRIRLIVGADLDPEDVQAVLAGLQERLVLRLNARLEGADAWPAEVARGVELLAWMVAHGALEMRVALRIHTRTGEPLTGDATDDGYVHEKWAIFTDGEGNTLYASGSLNESRTALVLNAENLDVHCDWWERRDRQRVEEARRDFERLWEDRHPALRVLPLPEAVRQRLIHLAAALFRPVEIDGTSAAPVEVPLPSALERLRFALIQDGPRLPGGRYVGLETAPVEPWPHQRIVARRLVETWPYSYLLGDEVGLGKTIEAGLAIRSLVLSGLARRVLIAPPASLTEQWQREMADKFLLPFARAAGRSHAYLLPYEHLQPAESLYEPDLCIVSTGLLARKERSRELRTARAFDIALLDEAHYARRGNPGQGTRVEPRHGRLFRTLQEELRPRSRSLWLATATPMQINPVEVADLLSLTRRVGPFQFDPTLMLDFYQVLERLVDRATGSRGEGLEEGEWEFLRRTVRLVEGQDPYLWRYLQKAVIDGPTRMAAEPWLRDGRVPHRTDWSRLLRLVFAAAPLSRVMLRHTRPLLEIYRNRGQLGASLPRRQVLPVQGISFTGQEQAAYDQLEGYCRGLAQQIAEQGEARHRSAVGFYLSFLRLRYASSLFAIRETLRRRLERVECTLRYQVREEEDGELESEEWEELIEEGDDDRRLIESLLRHRTPADLEWEQEQLGPLLDTLADLSGPSSKMNRLLEVVRRRLEVGTGRVQQMVVFTRFFDTLTDIVRRLGVVYPELRVGTYSGKGGQYYDGALGRRAAVEREEVKHRFLRGEIDILVCTDAAAEGLNLQTADLLVNFDLPWNPMKVEQRIGRIDRIGQRHEAVYVLHLCYLGSAEETVYGRLLHRLQQIGAIVGTQPLSLLPVTHEEFAGLADGTLREAELARRAQERAALARRRTASMEIPPEDLYAIYLRLGRQEGIPLPVTLAAIWETLAGSEYLCALGGVLRDDERVLLLQGIGDVPDGTALTVDRGLYDTGVPDLEGRLHFATYGDPVFQAVLDEVARFELPDGVRRLIVSVPGLPVEGVGYAVACIEEGQRVLRLITSHEQLEGLALDADAELSPAEIAPLQEQLQEMAREEFGVASQFEQVEAVNVQAGHSQLVLNYLLMGSLLGLHRQRGPGEEGFWAVVREVEEQIADQESRLIAHLPIERVRRLSGLLFEPVVPTLGQEGHLLAPRVALHAALEAVCRLAEGMRERKADLRLEAVLGRTEREVVRLLESWGK